MNELIIALIGGIIGSIATYYFSVRLLKKELELQQGNEFISKNYLPLLGAFTKYRIALNQWIKVKNGEMPNKNMKKPYTKEECAKIYAKFCMDLRQALENFVNSGVFLVIRNIKGSEELSTAVIEIFYHMQRWEFQPENISDPHDVDLNPSVIGELANMFMALPLSEVVKEYQSLFMKKATKSTFNKH